MNNDDAYQALFGSHPDDIKKIRKYIAWVKFRRMMNNQFYFNAHWITKPKQKYHWL